MSNSRKVRSERLVRTMLYRVVGRTYNVTGATSTARWLVTNGHFNAITMDCASGIIMPDGDLFTISGGTDEIKAIRVKLVHVASATPPLRLYCSNDSGVSFTDC